MTVARKRQAPATFTLGGVADPDLIGARGRAVELAIRNVREEPMEPGSAGKLRGAGHNSRGKTTVEGPAVYCSSTTFTTSATSLSPSCLVVTLRIQPSLMSESESACSTNPAFPGSGGRTNFTIFDSGLSTIVTSRVLPFETV